MSWANQENLCLIKLIIYPLMSMKLFCCFQLAKKIWNGFPVASFYKANLPICGGCWKKKETCQYVGDRDGETYKGYQNMANLTLCGDGET